MPARPSTRTPSTRTPSTRTPSTRTTSPRSKSVAAADPPQPIGYASDVAAVVQLASPAVPDTIAGVIDEQVTFGSLDLPPVQTDLPPAGRGGEVLRLANEAFAQTGSWVVFYREMMSVGGVVDQVFPDPEDRRDFETTAEFAELLEMLTSLRSVDQSKVNAFEPSRVITIRMPRSLHNSIVREAAELELSINKFCLTKLLQPAAKRFTPEENGKVRGRRPGPQLIQTKVKRKRKKG